jgi:hypothetical protein
LASQFHTVVQFKGLEALLKATLSVSPGVTIAPVNLYKAWRRADGLPPVEHPLRLIHLINPVFQATDKASMRTSRTWRNAHELVRSGHVRAALGELGSEVTTVDVPNEIRWHDRLGCLETLSKIKPHLIQPQDEAPANLRATGREFAAKLLELGFNDSDDLGRQAAPDGRSLRDDVPGADQAARVCQATQSCAASALFVGPRRSRSRTGRWASRWHWQCGQGCLDTGPWPTGS